MNEWFDDNKGLFGVGAIALVLGVSQFPNIAAKLQRDQVVSASTQSTMLNIQQLQAGQMLRDQQAAIADERYKTGCELLVATSNLTQASVIREGWPVILTQYAKEYKGRAYGLTDIHPGHTMPPGVDVCDAYGNTARTMVVPGQPFAVMQQLASTPNRETMRRVLDARKGVTRPAVGN